MKQTEEDSRTYLPQASTTAYKEQSALVPHSDGVNVQLNLSSEEAAKVFKGLNEIKSTLDDAVEKSSLPAELGNALQNVIISILNRQSLKDVYTALQTFRSACGEMMHMLFHSGNKPHSEAVNTMLHAVNRTCEPVSQQIASSTAPTVHVNPLTVDEQRFHAAEELTDILTISVDPELIGSRALPLSKIEKPPLKVVEEQPSAALATAPPPPGKRPRGRPRGGGSSGAGPAAAFAGVKRPKTPSIWNIQLQRQLAQCFRLVLQSPPASNPTAETDTKEQPAEALTPILLAFVNALHESGAGSGMRSMGATLPNLCNKLQVGEFYEPEEMLGALGEEAHASAEVYLMQENPDVRRGKVIAVADSFCVLVGELLDRVLAELSRNAKATRLEMAMEAGVSEMAMAETMLAAERPVVVKVPLSIQANREPYRHGDWRKTPFVPRPYVRLQEYFVVEESTRPMIERKLRTGKKGGCTGDHCRERENLGTYSLEAESFATPCTCLSRNTECDETCGCAADEQQCLNRAVSKRETVKLGEDVQEINSWGMDCYTRRNIQDALLESQAFGEYEMPDYKKILQRIKQGLPPMIAAAATAAGQHAAVAADSPEPPPPAVAGPSTANGDAVESNGDVKMEEKEEKEKERPPLQQKSKEEIAKQKATVERAVIEWIERTLQPAINRLGDNGWDIKAALQDVKERATAANDQHSLIAAQAIESRLDAVGYNYFRIHPKGVGLVCKRTGGIPKLTFVEEYLGEIHTPHRWFELQDAVKKITGDELPDFYNIALERPRDDPDGYDILFVDAAAKGAHASRMSHSCTPNCQAVVMACDGRLTIALYTLRHVHEGEELTFDYSSVTESEKEFREAICLCGTYMCRGSYLYFTGSRAFMQVMTIKHNMLHRQAILARAGMEPLTDADKERLKRYGIGNSCLGREEDGDRVPPWLEKWAALICEYLEVEEACLKQELFANDPYKQYTEATAGAEAKGVVSNRVQNIAITLDKVRAFLSQPGQPRGPVLRPLTDQELIDHLWCGPKAVGKRLLKGAIGAMGATPTTIRSLTVAEDDEALADAISKIKANLSPRMQELCDIGLKPAATPVQARENLQSFIDCLRKVDMEVGGGLTAAADIGQLYASTQQWITHEREYKSYMADTVPINLQDLFLNREATQLALPPSPPQPVAASTVAVEPVVVEMKVEELSAAEATEAVKQEQPQPTQQPTGVARTPEEEAAALAAAKKHANAMAKRNKNNPALRKQYRPTYPWGQLSGWFKQTVNDPTASLSAERRGTLSLPDIESCFGGSGKGLYGPKQRFNLIDHITHRPDSMWKVGSQWSFRNDAKIYGSPMFDAAWAESGGSVANSLPGVITVLREAIIPFEMPKSGGGSKSAGRKRGMGSVGGGRKPNATAAGRGKRGRGRPKKHDDYDSDMDEF